MPVSYFGPNWMLRSMWEILVYNLRSTFLPNRSIRSHNRRQIYILRVIGGDQKNNRSSNTKLTGDHWLIGERHIYLRWHGTGVCYIEIHCWLNPMLHIIQHPLFQSHWGVHEQPQYHVREDWVLVWQVEITNIVHLPTVARYRWKIIRKPSCSASRHYFWGTIAGR